MSGLVAYEADGMRTNISKSEAIVLSQKRMECPLRVRNELVPQVEAGEGSGRQIGAARTITGMLYQSTVVKRELGVKVKLSVYKVDLHSYPHLWL